MLRAEHLMSHDHPVKQGRKCLVSEPDRLVPRLESVVQ